MYQVDEKPETIHLYVVREEVARPSIAPIVLSVVALSLLIALGVLLPYKQPEIRTAIRVPAVYLPLKTFTASSPIIPTGTQTYPATQAHGTLTLTNGSVLSEVLPQGIIFTGKDGVEVVTQASVFIPPGSASGYGVADVQAQAVVSGSQGNIAAFSINAVYGTSLYIRNVTAFHGGKDAYLVRVVTSLDKQTALDSARAILASQQAHIHKFLAYPCKESSQIKNLIVGLSWACQYVAYSVPLYMQITAVHLVGKNLLVDVVFVARPRRIETK